MKFREAPIVTVGLLALTIGWGYAVYLYLTAPEALPSAQVGLPTIVCWFGLGASLVVCGFMVWIFRTIGTAGTKHLFTFDDMQLVARGPYSRIRHPMYAGMLLHGVAWLMMTDNWGVGGGFLLLIGLVLVVRVRHEEVE
ncbi:MAG: protein-S-isoprenylcysteine O-methyltransferase Ste14 [Planctomycetota bacterium]|jgi:protein-S-isoprenylcysteine O-methyltransferase Ste14